MNIALNPSLAILRNLSDSCGKIPRSSSVWKSVAELCRRHIDRSPKHLREMARTPQKNRGAAELKAEVAKMVPCFIARFRGPGFSVCKGHWLEIRNGVKICYAQWKDVGPFCTDSAAYVFGNERPPSNENHGAGIDVSFAVRDYLGLGSSSLVDRRFVEQP